MKRFLFALAVTALAVSCNKEDKTVYAEFGQKFYTIYANGSLQIDIHLSRASSIPISIPVLTSGTADIGADFNISGQEVTFQPGETKSYLTIDNLALTANKSISLLLGNGEGYELGTNYSTFISQDEQEALVYSFMEKEAVLLESYIATIVLTGTVSKSDFKATEMLSIPLVADGEGADEIIVGNVTIAPGENKGMARISLKKADFSGNSIARLRVAPEASRYIPTTDETCDLLLQIRGLQTPDRFLGKWSFDHIYDLETIELFAMEDEVDLSGFLENEGFTMEFKDIDGNVTLTTSRNSDYSAYFLESSPIQLTTPKNYASDGILTGKYTVQESNMYIYSELSDGQQVWTYYSIIANKKFSKTEIETSPCVIAFRLTLNGDLQMQFREYDLSRFKDGAWGSSFDGELFGFASLFKKAE